MFEDLLPTTLIIISLLFSEPTFEPYRAISADKIRRIGISRRKSEEENKSGNGARTTANFVKNKSNAFSNGQYNPLRSVHFVLATVSSTHGYPVLREH